MEARFPSFSEHCFQDFFSNAVPLPRQLPQCHLTHANSSDAATDNWVLCSQLGFQHSSQILRHISTCLLDNFLWVSKPHLKLHFTLPELYILLLHLSSPLGLQGTMNLLTSASPLRETLPLAYLAFNYHTFIHEIVVWRKHLTTYKSSVEDTH